jgi:hypothetical protein
MRWTIVGAVFCLLSGAALAAEPQSRAEQEKEFAARLTDAVLVGSFSVDGRDGIKSDRYEIAKAEKLDGDNWEITARVKFGDNDLMIPIVLKVFWADDTPVMSLTNLTIPGLGEGFSTRLMFYGDRYAGTWDHGKVGGAMWGRIEKKKQKPVE